jgi:hypothetical protein
MKALPEVTRRSQTDDLLANEELDSIRPIFSEGDSSSPLRLVKVSATT